MFMTQIEIKTIEDCVQHLVNLGSVEVSDRIIMNSVYRQLGRNLALTDRQHAMLKEKLIKYQSIFDIDNFDSVLNTVRMPLRTVDRSKTIRISELPDVQSSWRTNVNLRKENVWAEVRFPFHKKTIKTIEEMVKKVCSQNYYHENKSHSHFFVLNESTVVTIVETFKDRNFEIEQEILDFYNEVVKIKQSPEEYIPMFDLDQLVNVKQAVRDRISQELIDDPLKLFDRRRRYGITDYGVVPRNQTLLEQVVFRDTTDFLSNPEEHKTQDILDVVYQLNRYPMVVVLNEKTAEDEIHEFYNEVKTYIPNQAQSVLFRQEGNTAFNQFVKDKSLNNWVDNNTQIVYINSNKLPKLLLNGEFSPITCFMYGSRPTRFVDTYVQDHCDLIIFRDTELSPMRKYSSYYGNL